MSRATRGRINGGSSVVGPDKVRARAEARLERVRVYRAETGEWEEVDLRPWWLRAWSWVKRLLETEVF